jgi:hypothetical protein
LVVSIEALKTRGVAGVSSRSTSMARSEAYGKVGFSAIYIYIYGWKLYTQKYIFGGPKVSTLQKYDFLFQILFQKVKNGQK